MPDAVPTAGVVVFDGDRVLMVRPGATSKHERGVVGLPAGRVDPGETELGCAIRECREETGVELRAEDLIELPERYEAQLKRRDGSSTLMTWTVFAAVQHRGALRATEETEPFWAPLPALPGMTLQQNVAAAVAQASSVLPA